MQDRLTTTGTPPPSSTTDRRAPAVELDVLDSVQRRVLWLAVSEIHHANRIRTTRSGVKVGGHQSSSASLVSILSTLYFTHLEARDRVSVKPHAAPVLHAIEYLLGRLPTLETLRAYGGLQSYPSRVKDPFPVDFSTGSVGIGATQTGWSSIAHRYLSTHFDVAPAGRQVAVLGDAELDEGAVWEAIVDPTVSRLGELLWIVDVNRQSLDRIVPDIAIERLARMFCAAGWQTLTIKYGRFLRNLFAHGGEALQHRLDKMSNEEFQRLLRCSPDQLRERLPGTGPGSRSIARLVGGLTDREVHFCIRDLGGHDLVDIGSALRAAEAQLDRPTILFAYTIKAWHLPTQGHPGNHSALLTASQWRELAGELEADADDPWAAFPQESEEAALCRSASQRLRRAPPIPVAPPRAPPELRRSHAGRLSTQQAFGRFFVDLHRESPEVSAHVVTASPDVATSTNLGGWINHTGVWSSDSRFDWFVDDSDTLVHWKESRQGQHIELGIAEGNLVGLLSELGLTWARDGLPLFPVGTLYDPFVNRALEPWSFGLYSGAQAILVGTPSGVTLAPEGGAHQSVITPSVGLEQPRCTAWEPAFGQDLEWILLHAINQLGREGGTSSYVRLSTRPVDQALADLPAAPELRERRRLQCLSGGYPLGPSASTPPGVTLVGTGAVMVEVLGAADELRTLGTPVDVVCLTSADLVFRAFLARQGLYEADSAILEWLFPVERRSPIVTIHDGHPHTLAFVGGIRAVPIACLGVTDFGQSGDVDDLYRHFGIDTETIVGTALDVMER